MIETNDEIGARMLSSGFLKVTRTSVQFGDSKEAYILANTILYIFKDKNKGVILLINGGNTSFKMPIEENMAELSMLIADLNRDIEYVELAI